MAKKTTATTDTAGLTPAAQTASKAHAQGASRKAAAQPEPPEPNRKAAKATKQAKKTVTPDAPAPKAPTAAEVEAEIRRLKAEAQANERAVKATSALGQFLATIGYEGMRGDYRCALNTAAVSGGGPRVGAARDVPVDNASNVNV